MIDIVVVAMGAVTKLAPFLPFLIEVGKGAAKKLGEVTVEKGGESAWKQAQALWGKLVGRFQGDEEITDASKMLARAPDDDARREILAEVLASRLKENPEFVKELTTLLGGEAAVQQVTAGDDARIARIRQKMSFGGKQEVRGGNRAVIEGVDQEMDGT